MEIKRVQKSNKKIIREISRIHYSVLTESFLNNFGLDFLERIYTNLLESKDCILLVCEENEVVVGYALAFTDYSKFFQTAISKKILLGLSVVATLLRKPSFIKKILPSILKRQKEGNHAELQFIAVTQENRGKNIGTKLIEQLNLELKLKGIKNYLVGTKSENILSNQFYKKIGFKHVSVKYYFGDKLNFYISPDI